MSAVIGVMLEYLPKLLQRRPVSYGTRTAYRDIRALVLREKIPVERSRFEGKTDRKPSTKAELIEWLNDLARRVGVYQPDPSKPNYYCCTEESFGSWRDVDELKRLYGRSHEKASEAGA